MSSISCSATATTSPTAARSASARTRRWHRHQNQYRGYNPYGGGGYGQQYAANFSMRVVGITNVERRSSGLRVSGLIDSGTWYGQYGNQYWNQGNLNPRHGDLTFRCNVDYRGYVTNVRIRRNDTWRRPF